MIADLTMVKSGFCDRLKLLTFYIAVALVQEDPNLFIKEEKTHDGPFLFMEFCEIEGFTIKAWDDSMHESAGYGSRLKITYPFEPLVRPSLKFVRLNKPVDIKISDKEFLQIWKSCYQKIKPIARIRQKIDALNLEEKCVGLHIRMTDKCVPNILESVSPNCITTDQLNKVNSVIERQLRAQIAKNQSNIFHTKVYLACDSQVGNIFWKERLHAMGYEVISNNAQYMTGNFRQTSGEDFIVDLFSLARCRQIIGTVASGVPISAAYINGSTEYSFAFDKIIVGKYINSIRWNMYHRYHISLFDFHHSVILRNLLKIKFFQVLKEKFMN